MKIKKHKMIFVNCIVVGIISIVFLFVLLLNHCLEPYYRPNKEKMEKFFIRDKECLVIIKDYFINNPIATYISSLDFKSTNYSKLIKEEDVALAFNYLFKNGYTGVGKQGNTIYFLKWTRGSNLGIGIIYLINNENQPELQYITKLEALSESGWYFYESDYIKWKTQ